MVFQKGVKFRIYPNRKQQNLIDRTLGCSRLIYNKGLAMREDAFKSGEKCGYKQTSAMLTALKQDVNYAFLKEVDSIALQQALRNLDTGYTNFFEHTFGAFVLHDFAKAVLTHNANYQNSIKESGVFT